MKVIVGTKNPAKIRSIKIGFEKSQYIKNNFPSEEIEIFGEDVKSGVSEMPKTLEETILGAINRAENCQNKISGDFYIGNEGGTVEILGKAFIFGAVCVISKTGERKIATSNLLELTEEYRKGIYEDGKSLADISTQKSGISEIGKKKGTFGIITNGEYERDSMFGEALKVALSGFTNLK